MYTDERQAGDQNSWFWSTEIRQVCKLGWLIHYYMYYVFYLISFIDVESKIFVYIARMSKVGCCSLVGKYVISIPRYTKS